ncbi:glycosyltransferase [Baekduia soli]|uniref:Glycosyltransferase n=1 Tax=Baekduia soli TaxID=496014 RepID=A0A5B8U7Q6_9ACTN|nr:TIGR04282 family arsenosugar biosynthesis glycosyltransferase [Baekduia soli]QEC48987.1 glycosyltransferase [Baekduia soli]
MPGPARPAATTVAVIAKAPVPGRVKTRLCPPCTPRQAAALAEASLRDTLAAMDGLDAAVGRAIVLDGAAGPWHGTERLLAQRGGGLDERLAAAFTDLGGPALIVGMDTPQLRTGHLLRALGALEDHEAVLGPARDGGYWAIGLRDPSRAAEVLHGVPMSVGGTLAAQRRRLAGAALRWDEVDELHDVDTIADAAHVAALAPASRFAAVLQSLDLRRAA